MKYSFRKSFSSRRRRKDLPDVDLRNDNPICSNSNSNLVNPVKRKTRRSLPSFDGHKSEVFEPRYDVHSSGDEDDDENNQPFSSSSSNFRLRPFDRLTHQIRQSFRRTRREQAPTRSKLDDENGISILPPTISIGLTSPLPTDDHRENLIDKDKSNLHRSFRTRFSFFRRKSSNSENKETTTSPPTLTERFYSFRRSFHFVNRRSSNKGQRHLLTDE